MTAPSQHVLLLDAKQKRLNAGPKARLDTAFFLGNLGFRIQSVPTSRSRYWQRLLAWALRVSNWVSFKATDVVWCQFPVDKSTASVLEKARRQGLRTVAFVHDIEGLKPARTDWDSVAEQAQQLQSFTAVLGLNEVIGRILQQHGVAVAANLNLWDYVCSPPPAQSLSTGLNKRIVFAGSLAADKSPFIYRLAPLVGLRFELYGQGMDAGMPLAPHVRYAGSFAPESPPFQADGAIGLVWDGPEITTCGGDFGAYLAFNTPHKASMYLARGLPVAVWKDAAIAPLIAQHGAGLLVASLHELEQRVSTLSTEQYAAMASNAARLGEEIRAGHFITHAAVKLQASLA